MTTRNLETLYLEFVHVNNVITYQGSGSKHTYR